MSRPSRQKERRTELLPAIAAAFATNGYAGTTTAALAAATGLRENQLYRLWPSKKGMFLAVLEHLYDRETRAWEALLADAAPGDAIARILDEEGRHRGESGLHRITFAGLSEASDPDIRAALARMYHRFHAFITDVLLERAKANAKNRRLRKSDRHAASLTAWSLIALGSLTNIARELDLFPLDTQRQLFTQIGGAVIDRR